MSKIPPILQKTLVTSGILISLLLSTYLCFYNLGQHSIQTSDEYIHTQVVQEMIMNDRWWPLTFQSGSYFNKPPFKFWLTRAVIETLGESPFNYRIIDALCGLLTVCVTYIFALKLFSSHFAAFIAALSLLGMQSYLFNHIVRSSLTDSMFVMLQTLTAFFLYSWEQADFKKRKDLLLASFCISLSLITKSLAGLYMPGVFLIYIASNRKNFKKLLDNWFIILVALLIITIPFGLYAAAILAEPAGAAIAIDYELTSRFTKGYHNQDQIFYYLKALLNKSRLGSPAILILATLFTLIQAFRKQKAFKFVSLCVLFPLIVLSLIPSRNLWYLAPSFPAIALMLAGTFITIARLLKKTDGSALRFSIPKVAAAIFLLFFLRATGLNLNTTLRKVSQDARQSKQDLAVRAIKEMKTDNPDLEILVLNPDFTYDCRFDRVYYNMLLLAGARTTTEQEFRTLIHEDKDFVLTGSREIIESNLDANSHSCFFRMKSTSKPRKKIMAIAFSTNKEQCNNAVDLWGWKRNL